MDFTARLIIWYKKNYRDLAWKHTADPYKIWLSEIILQQTRVEQATPYYTRFVACFPTVQKLASASIDEVLKLWQGLGYYSRARNLHHAARQLVNDYDGKFPASCAELLKLKGVGSYTAAAIASFAFKEVVPALDGNAYRILARYFGVELPIDTMATKKQLTTLAQELIPDNAPDVFNQALMDFGSMVCTPHKPACEECPLQAGCVAYAKKLTQTIPVKSKRTAVRSRYFNYLLIKNGEYTYIRKREKKDIWQGLYEFPLIETAKATNSIELFNTKEWKSLTGKGEVNILYHSPVIKHLLSHQTIYATFYVLDITNASAAKLKNNYIKLAVKQLERYAFPQLIVKILHYIA